MGKIGIFDLEKHFAFYGAYHSNPINILIHMIFVWPIFFTSVVILYFTPALFDCPFKCKVGLVPNFGLVLAVVYGVFYVCLDKKAGTLGAILCLACWVFGSLLAKRLGFSLAWKVVLAAQLFCWSGQFIGHGVFEKRAPALLDNLTQAFLMAPFFVLLGVRSKRTRTSWKKKKGSPVVLRIRTLCRVSCKREGKDRYRNQEISGPESKKDLLKA